jgi:hypothetical protein
MVMAGLPDLIREYGELLDEERRLSERKGHLRQQILEAMAGQRLDFAPSPYGVARRCSRFKLLLRRDAVLGLLTTEDLFPFAQFAPNRVKTVLVPKYGRERPLPLFDIQ